MAVYTGKATVYIKVDDDSWEPIENQAPSVSEPNDIGQEMFAPKHITFSRFTTNWPLLWKLWAEGLDRT